LLHPGFAKQKDVSLFTVRVKLFAIHQLITAASVAAAADEF